MFINFCSFRIHCTLANHWNIWNSQPSKIAFVTAMEEPVFSNICTVTMKYCERNSWTLFYTSPKYLKSLACSSLSSLSSTLEDEFIDRCICCKSLNLRWSKTASLVATLLGTKNENATGTLSKMKAPHSKFEL